MIWYDFGPIRTSGSIVSTQSLHSLTETLKDPGSFLFGCYALCTLCTLCSCLKGFRPLESSSRKLFSKSWEVVNIHNFRLLNAFLWLNKEHIFQKNITFCEFFLYLDKLDRKPPKGLTHFCVCARTSCEGWEVSSADIRDGGLAVSRLTSRRPSHPRLNRYLKLNQHQCQGKAAKKLSLLVELFY